MISEIDIKDWEKVDFKRITAVQTALKDEELVYSLAILNAFIKQVELIRDTQIKEARKHIPVILQKDQS